MPKRKISIEECFAELQRQGVKVQVVPDSQDTVAPTLVDRPKKNAYGSIESTTPKRESPFTKIALFAKHSIASGGFVDAISKTVVDTSVQSYGPGIVTVPTHLCAQLLHQDALARQADERFLSPQRRCFIVAERSSSDGTRSNVGIEVPENVLNPSAMLEMVNMIPGMGYHIG